MGWERRVVVALVVVVGCGLWVVGCGLWVVGCGLWVVGCGLWGIVLVDGGKCDRGSDGIFYAQGRRL